MTVDVGGLCSGKTVRGGGAAAWHAGLLAERIVVVDPIVERLPSMIYGASHHALHSLYSEVFQRERLLRNESEHRYQITKRYKGDTTNIDCH
jgi:hypothetical protein